MSERDRHTKCLMNLCHREVYSESGMEIIYPPPKNDVHSFGMTIKEQQYFHLRHNMKYVLYEKEFQCLLEFI